MSREAISKLFEGSGAEALFITDPHNMWYLSGFRGGEGMVYLSPKRSVVITDSRYTEAASQESDFEVIEENHVHKRTRILRELLKADQAEIVGYEDSYMRCNEFSRLQNALSSEVQQWLPLGEQINEIRWIKSCRELELIETAERIGDEAFSVILQTIRPGMTEFEVAARIEYEMKIRGAEKLSFDTIVASGLHSSMPHAQPTEKKLADGDFVTMDFGCIYEGYCSDMTRTIVIGRADERQKEIYDLVLRAQTAALEGIRAGMTGNACDALARTVITDAGYGSYFGHALGHGVGLYIHESPRLSPSDSTILQAGMVESVEPGIYIPGFGGVRIEDLVVIEENGIRNLTHSPKELIEIS